jgi:hypothetical protein
MVNPRKRTDVTVDFGGVEGGGGRKIPDGEYLMEVFSIEEKESQDGNPYLAWKWKVCDGEYKGATIYDNTSLKATALWRLKTLLECLGVDVPNGKMGLNLKEYHGLSLLAEVTNETYQGKERPRISNFLRGIPKKGAATSSAPAAEDPFVKGAKVKFDYEGDSMTATIVQVEGSKLIVGVTIDGAQEEWELDKNEVVIA